jgi:tripartite-type tricarboxylate transporter receptor subunit TctC
MRSKMLVALGACLALFAGLAAAQNWPSKQITLVVATTPGGSLDLVARVLATHLERKYKQTVIVENRVGAGGILAGTALMQAPADGHMFATSLSPVTTLFVKEMPYRASDLVPAALVGMTPYNLMVSSASKFKTLAEFVAYAKANPGKIDFGTVASSSHETEIVDLIRVLGIDANRIGYKGIAPIYTGMSTGTEVQATISAFVPPMVKAGQIVILATGGDRRMADYPDVPTFRELGYEHYPRAFYTFYARAGTSREVLERFYADTQEAIKTPDFNDRVLKPFSVAPFQGSYADAVKVLQQDFDRQRNAAQRAGLKPQ